ncbi:unnamed protein product [Brachionus calyciflorus]|uniref:U1-type domain-containing protein n=1 Tax=Brachionus calyciflorus TaxID=104777 RepID=A0A814H665_9BILA|nr:unnamed protein product [Brachionus calyciflorus]
MIEDKIKHNEDNLLKSINSIVLSTSESNKDNQLQKFIKGNCPGLTLPNRKIIRVGECIRKTMSKYTPQKRIIQLNNKDLSVKKQKLFCNVCDQELDHLRKSSIEAHLDTPKHKSNSKGGTSQKALKFPEEEKKTEFLKDFIIGFGSANVLIHKLTKKRFKNIFQVNFEI